jgi:Toprim domain
VNDQKQFWHDFSSGKHGVFSFVMEMEGRTFPQAVEEIAALAGVSLPASYCSATTSSEVVKSPAATARFEAAEADYAREVTERLRKARSLWVRSLPAPGTIVETYLRARGYRGRIPATIRFLPRNGAYPPALIAAYGMATEDIRETAEPGTLLLADEDIVGIHLIKLKLDGSDRLRGDEAKITIGKDITAPIVLAAPNDGMALDIAEGIEDALNAHQITGRGAWAACSAGRLPKLADHIPNYIETITILVDDNDAGRTGAHGLAARAHARGIEVLLTPSGAPA